MSIPDFPNIPIVVVAYNRLHSLKRLLGSLDKSRYPGDVKLIISIDGEAPEEVVSFANNHQWQHGEKEVIYRDENLGLRAHILECGSLSLKYDGIVLLEDDLYVSPHFYEYLLSAQNHYRYEPQISGIALYSPAYNETACLPFTPIEDGHDVFFMQMACSWGQSWLSHQWLDFENWYKENKNLKLQDDTRLPPDVRLWPDTSWKKYFIKYNIENDKYFVYPRSSLSTNSGDAGTNHSGTKLWQVPLSRGFNYHRLPDFEDSFAKYDAFYELSPDCLKQFVPELCDYDFTVDLYGVKDKTAVHSEYVISRNDVSNHIYSFGCEIKPHELNIIDNIAGEHFKFGKTEDMQAYFTFLDHRHRIFTNYKETHPYFYPVTREHYAAFAKDISASIVKEEEPQEHTNPFVVPVDQPHLSEIEITAEQLVGHSNLHDLEFSARGSSYCWVGPSPEILFSLPICRNEQTRMQIYLVAVIKPEYLKQLRIYVDDEYVKHDLSKNKRMVVVSCDLPHSDNADLTEVRISLPATHSPLALGVSEDVRELGIAISRICFGKPESGFSRLFERLKSKS